MIGVIAVASAAYLSAVFLAADAVRAGDAELERAFRLRALGAGVLAGGLAVVGLIVLHSDAHRLFHGLVHGAGLAALIVSVLAGVAALWLVLASTVRAGAVRRRASPSPRSSPAGRSPRNPCCCET